MASHPSADGISRDGVVGSVEPRPGAFEREAERVAGEMRDLFAAVIEAGVGRVETAQDVAERFGVHRKLGWQIAKVAYGDGPLSAARYVPSSKSIRTWLDAAATRRVPPDLLRRVEEAVAGFERFIDLHCRDRETLEMMLGSCEAEIDGAAESKWRREAFLGNSYVFGVRAATLLSLTLLGPSARAGYLDVARVQGLLGFVRSRPNVRWVLAQTVAYSGQDPEAVIPDREPLDPETASANGGVPLMGAFCSSPTPVVQRRPGEHGILYDELPEGPIGHTGESDIVTGEVLRAVAPAHATHEGETADFGPAVRTPAERLVCDMLVHRDLFGEVERTVRVYSQVFSPVSRESRDELAVSERVQPLGMGLSRIHTPEAPRYARMASSALERLGWREEEFELYRIRMRYPPMPVSVMFHHALPPPAGG